VGSPCCRAGRSPHEIDQDAADARLRHRDCCRGGESTTTPQGSVLYQISVEPRNVAGADFKRRATKWRCPTGECKPASTWIKADRLHPLIPRDSKRSRDLYRSRGAVEREFGRLKHEWALLPLLVRGLDRVRLHADLTVLAKLACALSRARAAPLAA
jgi:hypothetical protein